MFVGQIFSAAAVMVVYH